MTADILPFRLRAPAPARRDPADLCPRDFEPSPPDAARRDFWDLKLSEWPFDRRGYLEPFE